MPKYFSGDPVSGKARDTRHKGQNGGGTNNTLPHEHPIAVRHRSRKTGQDGMLVREPSPTATAALPGYATLD